MGPHAGRINGFARGPVVFGGNGAVFIADNVNPGLRKPKRLFNWGDTI